VINRSQDPASKREEEFQAQVQQARQTPGGVEQATPEVREAATRQANFSEQRKKYLGGI
jgi:type II secretory pathway component PulM